MDGFTTQPCGGRFAAAAPSSRNAPCWRFALAQASSAMSVRPDRAHAWLGDAAFRCLFAAKADADKYARQLRRPVAAVPV